MPSPNPTASLEDIRPRLDYINCLQCAPGFETQKRCFSFPYLLYVYQGRGNFEIGGTVYDCRGGDLFFCPPGVFNTIRADKQDPFVLTGVDFVFFRDRSGTELPSPYPQHMRVPGDSAFHWLLREVLRQFVNLQGDSPYTQSLMKALLLLTGTLQTQEGSLPLAEQIRDRLLRAEGPPVPVVVLAESMGYHPNYLNRLFHRHTGISILQFQLEIRLQKALNLLKYTDQPVAEIARQCGFDNQSYFSRLFRKHHGCAPTAVRRRS